MRSPLICLLGLFALCGCSTASVGPSSHVDVVVDQEHQIPPNHLDGLHYVIAPASEVRLHVGRFRFTQQNREVTPDMVNVGIVGRGCNYELARPHVTNMFVLNAATLKVLHGTEFRGFTSGQTFVIAIGRSTHDAPQADWVGLITVK